MDWEDYKKESRTDFEDEIYVNEQKDNDLVDEVFDEIMANEDDVEILLSPYLTSSQLEEIIDGVADNDDMERWYDDKVWDADFRDTATGNDCGSKTLSRAKAKDNVQDVLWDSRFRDGATAWGLELDDVLEDPERTDVTARYCALDDQYWDIKEDFIARVRGKLNEKINKMRHDKKKLGEVLLPD